MAAAGPAWTHRLRWTLVRGCQEATRETSLQETVALQVHRHSSCAAFLLCVFQRCCLASLLRIPLSVARLIPNNAGRQPDFMQREPPPTRKEMEVEEEVRQSRGSGKSCQLAASPWKVTEVTSAPAKSPVMRHGETIGQRKGAR